MSKVRFLARSFSSMAELLERWRPADHPHHRTLCVTLAEQHSLDSSDRSEAMANGVELLEANTSRSGSRRCWTCWPSGTASAGRVVVAQRQQ